MGYLPRSLTEIDNIPSLKKWLEDELDQIARFARGDAFSRLTNTIHDLSETVELREEEILQLTGRMTTAEGDILTVTASVAEETLLRISADEALASNISAVSAAMTIQSQQMTTEIQARVLVEEEARVTADAAMATRIVTIESSYVTSDYLTANYATASEIATTYASKDEVTATLEDYVTVTFLETNYATVSTISSTYATQANAYAYHTLKLDVNGYVSGTTSTNNGDVANITFITDNMYAAKPGSVAPAKFLETGVNAAGATTIVLIADRLKINSVDTPNIVTEAATAVWSETDATVSTASAGTTLAQITVNVEVGTLDVYFEGDMQFTMNTASGAGAPYVELGFYVDSGALLFSRRFHAVNISGTTRITAVGTMSRVLTGVATGSRIIKVKMVSSSFDDGQDVVRTVTSPFIRVIETRR